MIKKLKLGLLSLAALSLLVGSTANAAALTYSVAQTIDLSDPDINLTIVAASEATSVVVGTGTLTVTVPSGSTFVVTSASRSLSADINSSSEFIVSRSCSSALVETVTLVGVSSAGTAVLTPGPSACVYSSGGGGGGGGVTSSSYATTSTTAATTTTAAATVAATPAVPATPGTVIPGCGNRTTGFSSSTGSSCVGNTSTTPATPAISASASASSASSSASLTKLGTATLKNGSKGDSVKELQKILNKILKTSLAVDGKLGPKTIATIKTWQKAHGLVADGLVGKLTKAAMVAEANK